MTARVPGRLRRGYARILEWVVSALVIALAVEVTVGVVFRFAGHALDWYDEVASVLLAWLTFYGAALASLRRAHIGCPELVDALPWRWRRAIGVIVQLLVIAFFVLLGSVGAWIMPVLATDSLTSLPQVPMSIVQSVIPISSLLIVIAEGLHLIDLLGGSGPPIAEAQAVSEALQ
jgi:TRAP-type C4-dicarboxylate transport system permease small subunit